MRSMAPVWLTFLICGSAAAEQKLLPLDLATASTSVATRMTATPGENFNVEIQHRMPQARYRATVLASSPRGFAGEHGGVPTPQLNDIRPGGGKIHLLPTDPDGCRQLLAAWEAVAAAPDEGAVAVLAAKLQPDACPRQAKWVQGLVNFETRRSLIPSLALKAGETLTVTVERLDADGAVQKRWQAIVEAPALRTEWAHPDEEAWLIAETASDIVEMLSWAKDRSRPLPVVKVERAGAVGSRYAVSFTSEGNVVSQTIGVASYVWAPAEFQPLVMAEMKRLRLSAKPSAEVRGASPLAALTTPRALTIEQENQRVSQLLTRGPLDPAAHEQAALVQGALALRESAGEFHDPRFLLCRMAAHLALAGGLSPGRKPSPAGAYAEVVLLVLAGRDRDALARLDAIDASGGADRAWSRALRLRAGHDWRILERPLEATLLERLEHFRAVGSGVGGETALGLLARGDDVTDWGHVALAGGPGVAEGNIFLPATLKLEMAELAAVWKAAQGSELAPAQRVSALQAQPERAVGKHGLRVIPWGIWGDFFQRHTLHLVLQNSDHLQRMLGLPKDAAQFAETSDVEFGALARYPLVRIARPRAERPPAAPTQEAIRECEAAAKLLATRPDLVSPTSWERVDRRCHQEKAAGILAEAGLFYPSVFPAGTLYDAERRIRVPALIMKNPLGPQMPALRALSSTSRVVGQLVLTFASVENKKAPETADAVAEAFGVLKDYDKSVMWRLAGTAADRPDEYRRLFEPICQIDPDSCYSLGEYLAQRGLEDQAAVAYQRAVDGNGSALSMSHNIDWLLDYHFDRGHGEKALELAQRAAAVYSGKGLLAMSRLSERMGRYEEAESWLRKYFERYSDSFSLDNFYIRYERRVGDGRFKSQAQAALAKRFPAGIERVAMSGLAGPPAQTAGFMVASTLLQKDGAGILRPTDIVVALNGYRTQNYDQYSIVRAFTDEPDMTIVIWRDGHYQEIKAKLRRWLYGKARPPAGSA